VKFFARTSQAIYLSRRGPLPPPLRFFDVYYIGYPAVDFAAFDDSYISLPNVLDDLPPDLSEDDEHCHYDEALECQDESIEEAGPSMAHLGEYGRQTGDMDETPPMRFPSRASGNLSQIQPAIQSIIVIHTPDIYLAEIKHFIVIDGEP